MAGKSPSILATGGQSKRGRSEKKIGFSRGLPFLDSAPENVTDCHGLLAVFDFSHLKCHPARVVFETLLSADRTKDEARRKTPRSGTEAVEMIAPTGAVQSWITAPCEHAIKAKHLLRNAPPRVIGRTTVYNKHYRQLVI